CDFDRLPGFAWRGKPLHLVFGLTSRRSALGKEVRAQAVDGPGGGWCVVLALRAQCEERFQCLFVVLWHGCDRMTRPAEQRPVKIALHRRLNRDIEEDDSLRKVIGPTLDQRPGRQLVEGR